MEGIRICGCLGCKEASMAESTLEIFREGMPKKAKNGKAELPYFSGKNRSYAVLIWPSGFCSERGQINHDFFCIFHTKKFFFKNMTQLYQKDG